MANYAPPRKQTQNRQIIIQEQPDDTSDIHEQLQQEDYHQTNHNNQDYAKSDKEKGFTLLKIHKEKLLRYEPLKQRNIQRSSQITKKPLDHKTMIAGSVLNKSNSYKMLKYIKHKVEVSNKRLKTASEKENESFCLLPKMTQNKLRESSKIMNKTVSSINFKQSCQEKINRFDESKQSNQTFIRSRLQTQIEQPNNHRNGEKTTEECVRLNSNRSSSKISQQKFTKTLSLSKFKTSNLSSGSQISYSHSEIMAILGNINERQGELVEQKKELEERIAALKEGIEKQHAFIIEIAKSKQRMSSSMARKEHQSRNSASAAKLSKKKNQNFQSQTKDLQQKLYQTSNINSKVLQSVQQQKQLIRMYEMVIQQVRNQLKTQKKEKLQIQKRLAIIKKNQKSLQSKLSKQEDVNKQILRKVYASLQRWS